MDDEGEELGAEAGDVLAGRFELVSVLGIGGMGSVWRAHDRQLSSPVAVKIIRPDVAQNPNSRARFLREAKAAARLRSPHVVQILECGEDEERIFMAMEMLEGESLFDRLCRFGTLDWPTVATIFTHVGRAMSRAHEAGIVHRDLKPDNIFLVDNDDEILAKVLDFGIAKSEVAGLDLTGESPRTQTGAVLGTPYYMSPEQATAARDVDHRADLWAMGVIAFECLVGERPYGGSNLGDLVLNICSRAQPVPSRLGDVPPGFDAWFARAQARDRAQRFQSARELVQSLREVLLESRPKASAITQAAGSPRKPSTIEIVEGNDETTEQPLQPLVPTPIAPASAADPALATLEAVTTEAPRKPSWVVGAVAISLFVVMGVAIGTQVIGEPERPPATAAEGDEAPPTEPSVPDAEVVSGPPVEPAADTSASLEAVPSASSSSSSPKSRPSTQAPSPRPRPRDPQPPPPPPPPDDPLDI